MKILEIKDLNINYKMKKEEFICLKNINIELNKGEILGIVGESGSGKSTLAKAIIGMLPKSAVIKKGQILYFKNEILYLNKKKRAKIQGNHIGVIFQDSMNSLNPVRRIKEQFIEILKEKKDLNKEKAYEKAIEMLNAVNLDNPKSVINKFPFQLSGGQKQRIVIAMAFVLEPKILIADEPTTALDVTVQAQVLRELNKLKVRHNTSIILISHNLGVVSQLCDKIAVMYNGEIVEFGSTNKVLEKPKHKYTKALIECVPDLELDKSKKLYSINQEDF